MRKWNWVFCFLILPQFCLAQEVSVPLLKSEINLEDKASLQRGAKYYMNYCVGCHSLQYMRYNRIGADLGIDTQLLKDNLIFNDVKPFDFVINATPVKEAKEWFGVAPPDLTLEARVRGSDWIYTYLLSFYEDEKRPWGVNNMLFPDVAMPNILGVLQGKQIAVFTGHEIDHLLQVANGQMDPPQFESTVRDITNFLSYVAEPVRLTRIWMGYWVLAFLIVFAVLAYLMKKEFWKDIKGH